MRLLNAFSDWWATYAQDLITVPARIALILALAIVLRLLAKRLINHAVSRIVDTSPKARPGIRSRRGQQVVDRSRKIAAERRRQRAKSLAQVLSSVASILLFSVAAMLILAEVGIALAPIIASAGIIGVAIGFGAQSLVADYLSGIFMLTEDQYGVGDWVDVGDASGMVEEVGLRVTQLRDADGVLWFVRNSQIARVGNHSQDWAQTILDVPIAYDEDLARAEQLLLSTASELWDDPAYTDLVLDQPELWGVQELNRDAVVLRMAVRTGPLQQWGVARELRRRIKANFDREGVQIPYPQQVVWISSGELTGSDSRDG